MGRKSELGARQRRDIVLMMLRADGSAGRIGRGPVELVPHSGVRAAA